MYICMHGMYSRDDHMVVAGAVHVVVPVCVYVYVCVCVCVCIFVCMYVCMVCIYEMSTQSSLARSMLLYLCVCVYVCMCVYVMALGVDTSHK